MRKSIFTLICLAWLGAMGGFPAFAGEAPPGAYPRAWGSLEYLNLWTPSAPLPFPLVTTGDAAGMGILGSPSTRVVMGDEPLAMGCFPGFRATVGGWFSDYDNLGAEISGFATGVRVAHFQAASDSFGSPLLAVPFANVTSGAPQESSLVIAQPGVRRGRISANDASIFGGFEVDGLINLPSFRSGADRSVSAICGVRFISLTERFQFSSVTIDTTGFLQGHNDFFMAQNDFVGVEFGLRGARRFKRLTFEMTGKTAFGTTWQGQSISSQSGPFLSLQPNAGFFTQPSNSGAAPAQNSFSVVPAARFRVGYDLTRRLRLTLSYEGLLWTHVIRPSNQLDREINLSQTVGPLVGVARPAAQHRQSDFWAQGFTAGLQLNY